MTPKTWIASQRGMTMTLETEPTTFRGVVCLHCKAPIPVPAIVGSFLVANDETEASQRKSQVFNLRCSCCHKEKPYRTREIVEFEGTPETTMPDRPTPVRWYPQDGLTRAAKA
jgi:hypothetical protein